MNERIKELAEQAGYTPLPGFDFANELQEVFLNKFAELIVGERIVTGKGYNYGKHYLPHDAKAKTLASGGKSIQEMAQKALGVGYEFNEFMLDCLH